jgi:hypothetical protein
MKRARFLAPLAALVALSCQDQPPPTGPDLEPLPEIVDDHDQAEADQQFLLLAPITNDLTAKDEAPINADIRPVVKICEWNGTGCVAGGREWTLTMGGSTTMGGTVLLDHIFLSPDNNEYVVFWNASNLTAGQTYRIRVLIGEQELGRADAQVWNLIEWLRKVKDPAYREDFVPLLKNSILPIRFWIGENALCAPGTPACSSETIQFGPESEGGTVELQAEIAGEQEIMRFTIAPGTEATSGGQTVTEVTFNLETCEGIAVDLPTFGPCLRVTSFFAGSPTPLELTIAALISLCHFGEDDPHRPGQEELITLHQQDGAVIRALPHADPACDDQSAPSLGARSPGDGGGGTDLPAVVLAGWRALRDWAVALFMPRPLFARSSVAVLNLGGGGETDLFGAHDESGASSLASVRLQDDVGSGGIVSDFQFALPAKMEIVAGTDGQQAAPGTAVEVPPAVFVSDLNDHPVEGATVRFAVSNEVGVVALGTTVPCGSNASLMCVRTGTNGMASVASWTLDAGTNMVEASGRGIAAPNHYPEATVRPFMPVIHDEAGNDIPADEQEPVILPAEPGVVEFTATAFSQPDLVISSGALTVTPTLVAPGGTVTLSAWKIKNQGSGAVPSETNVNVAYFLSTDATITRTDVFLGSSFVTGAGMTPGQEIAGPSLVFTIPASTTPGDHWIGILADQDNAVVESSETNNFVSTPLKLASSLLVRPSSDALTAAADVTLPLMQPSGLSMQDNTGIQLEVSPGTAVTWSSSDPTSTKGSVNTTGLLAVVQGNDDPNTANEAKITATGLSAIGSIKVNSFSFDHFPRLTTLVWRPVEGAATYDVLVQIGDAAGGTCTSGAANCTTWFGPFLLTTTSNLHFVFAFNGAQPGRWQVVAKDASGEAISTSELVYFRYIN